MSSTATLRIVFRADLVPAFKGFGQLGHRQREWLRKQQQAREDMYERHAQIALGMLARVAKRVAAIDVDDVTPPVLATWFRTAVHVERLARGEPTEVVQAIEPTFDDGPNDLLDYGPEVREAHNALLLALAAAKGNNG